MIARHSAEESKGGGDGVEVVVNKPCHDPVHGDGQYTEKKIYLSRCVSCMDQPFHVLYYSEYPA